MCLSSRFEIAWGDRGEHTLVLDPLDMISVPRGENRSFRNIGNETGRPCHDRAGNRRAGRPDFLRAEPGARNRD